MYMKFDLEKFAQWCAVGPSIYFIQIECSFELYVQMHISWNNVRKLWFNGFMPLQFAIAFHKGNSRVENVRKSRILSI